MPGFDLGLPQRSAGLTHVIDKGLGPRGWEDVLEVSGHLIDVVKLGWGTSYVTKRLERKLSVLKDKPVVIGGTLFGSRANRLKPEGFRSPSEALAHWVDPQEEILSITMGVMACPPTNPSPPSGLFVGEVLSEPAETPLPLPTAEQLEAIHERLAP